MLHWSAVKTTLSEMNLIVAILTSLKMMEIMLAKKVPMSKLAELLKIYPQVLENIRVTDKKAAQNTRLCRRQSRLWPRQWAILVVFWCVSPARSR
jgi:hypothetical protein